MSPAVWSYCDQIERNINSTEKLWEIDVVLRIIELLIVFPDLWAGGHHRVALQRLPQGCLSSSSRRGLPCRGQRVHLTLWASLERLPPVPQGCLPSSPNRGLSCRAQRVQLALWAALQRLSQGYRPSSSNRGLPCRGQRVHLTLWASIERLPQGCLPSSSNRGLPCRGQRVHLNLLYELPWTAAPRIPAFISWPGTAL